MFMFAAVPAGSEVVSPDGRLRANLAVESRSASLSLSVTGQPMLTVGRLGLDLRESGPLEGGLRLKSVRQRRVDTTWKALAGKTSRVRDHFREATFSLEEAEGRQRRMEIVVRAYDDGFAFRYRLPKQRGIADASVREELTEFRPVGDPKVTALVLPNTNTPYEEPYQQGTLASLKDKLIGMPTLFQGPAGRTFAITEAHLSNYPGMYLVPKGDVVTSRLSPRLDGSGIAVRAGDRLETPWRVVLVGDPNRIVESNLVLNLNPPSVLKDTSWIRPGKTLFPWWNGYDTGKTGIKPAQTTEYHKWCIDFCAANKIPYHSLDGLDNIAWYGGTIVPYTGGAITKGLPGLDFEEVVRYAKSKGVRIRLWMNSQAAKAQMRVAYPIYERMGIEGVMVDFFDHDDQDTVRFVEEVVAMAARHRLTITLHNIYKPTGLERTYPNLLSVEAARNLEFDKWDPVGILPEHEILVAFVRMPAGPIDFHSGSFRNVSQRDFRPINVGPLTIGTRARQLARYVVYEGALPMLSDSPVAYEGQPGFSFLLEVPTTWDETRVLAGEVGRFIVVARRKGDVWYLGAMTDGTARQLELPLSFLGKGRYTVESWTDGKTPGDVVIEKGVAEREILLDLAEAGGAAVRFVPMKGTG
ncbi:MAG: glycoside hydrolase family 97 protein [Fimbriimonas sp.]